MAKTLTERHEDVPPTYYDKGIKHNVLQKLWHTKRFQALRSFIQPPTGRILDVGCHSGLFTKQLVDYGENIEVYGIDISNEAIAYAKKRIKEGHFVRGDAHTLPFTANFFDQVYSLEMLEHVELPERVLQEMHRVLKKNGQGVILVPVENRLFKSIWFLWNIHSRVWKHTHIQSFTQENLVQLITSAKFRVTNIKKSHLNMLLFISFQK